MKFLMPEELFEKKVEFISWYGEVIFLGYYSSAPNKSLFRDFCPYKNYHKAPVSKAHDLQNYAIFSKSYLPGFLYTPLLLQIL